MDILLNGLDFAGIGHGKEGSEFKVLSFIDKVKEKIKEGKYFMSQHAIVESAKDMIDDEDMVTAILNGELVEDCPDDKRGRSCLVCGMMKDERYLHIVVGMVEENVVIITTYLPSLDKWETPIKRRVK